jgi:hypothetical protein
MTRSGRFALLVAAAFGAAIPASARAQQRKVKVVSSDSTPIVYAYVTIEGGIGQITDEKGEVNLGTGKHKTFTVNVRRIGYQPWFGKLEFPDTTAMFTIALPRLTQTLGAIHVSGRSGELSVPLQKFYDRWEMRQKGALSATFIGPEEIEGRHPTRTSDLFSGLSGVALVHSDNGAVCARSNGGSCFMTVMIDGNVFRNASRMCYMQGALHIGRGAQSEVDHGPDLNDAIDINDIAAVEVYTRGGNMPVTLQAPDNACGVLAIWTGSRK